MRSSETRECFICDDAVVDGIFHELRQIRKSRVRLATPFRGPRPSRKPHVFLGPNRLFAKLPQQRLPRRRAEIAFGEARTHKEERVSIGRFDYRANGIDYVFARLLVHKHVPSLRCLSRQVYQCSGARGNSSSANPSEQINTSVYAISYNAEESPAVCRRAGYYPRSADGAEEPSNSQLDHMPFRYRFTRGRCSRCGHSTCRRVVECRTLVISTERATHKGGTDGQAR